MKFVYYLTLIILIFSDHYWQGRILTQIEVENDDEGDKNSWIYPSDGVEDAKEEEMGNKNVWIYPSDSKDDTKEENVKMFGMDTI